MYIFKYLNYFFSLKMLFLNKLCCFYIMNLVDFFNDNFWAAVSLVSLITVPVTSAINIKFNLKKIWKQITSWGVSLILTVAVYFLGMISIGEPVWLALLLTGIGAGLSANGIYDIPTIRTNITKWITILMTYNSIKEDKDKNK